MRMLRLTLGLVIVAALPLTAGAQRPATVTVIHQDVSTALNPLTEIGYPHVLRLVYNGLVDYSPYPEHRIVPGLAESWQVSPDSRTFTFKLRRGVKWHDGAELTAADVAFTWERLTDATSGSAFASLLPALERVETPDPATVTIRLREPSASFLAWTWLGIMPRHVWEKEDVKTSAYNQKPIGSGPFKLASWSKGDSMVFEANPAYFRGRPAIDRVILKVIPDANVAFSALERGEIDAFVFRGLVGGVPWPIVERLKRNPAFVVNEFPVSSVQSLHFGLEHPLFRNLRVRQAVAHAIDRQAIISNVLFGKGQIVDTPIAPPTFAEFHNAAVRRYDFDPAKANRLLDEAGHPRGPNGVRFATVLYGTPGARARMNEIIRENLRAVGIDAALENFEWNTYFERIRNTRELGKRGLFSLLSVSRLPDPEDNLGFVYGKNANKPGGRNYSEYVNPRVDELIEQGRRAADPARRAALYKEIQAILAEDLPMLPLYLARGVDVWKATLKGVASGEFGGGTLASLERASLEPAR
jgi:peptide/nickel transport system substrate-binding protein